MADGDKMVPSEGNPKLDPTKKSGSGPEPVVFAREKATSRRLESFGWVKNQSGLLTRRSDLYQNVESYQVLNRFSKKPDQGVMSVESLQDRGDMDYLDSLNVSKKRGSSQGDEQAGDEEESAPSYSPPSAPRVSSNFSIPSLSKSFTGMSTLKEMMEMPIANVPSIGPHPRICGPAIIGTMNFTGAAMQSNAPETMTIGKGINMEATQ
jgi:hypothetical protein